MWIVNAGHQRLETDGYLYMRGLLNRDAVLAGRRRIVEMLALVVDTVV